MIGEYRFFQEFFDGQIIKKESEGMKLFKVMLFSLFSVAGLALAMLEICNWAEFILLELGMLWNIYSGLGKRVSVVLAVLVGLLYFFFSSNFGLYANGLIYISCYIPFQLIATTKDYSEGDFIQIKKNITDYNKILFVMLFCVLFVFLALFDVSVDSNFVIYDSLAAALLICSAILRNERYVEYYIFRIFALAASILLWGCVAVEFGVTGSLAILLMYSAYLVYDVVNVIVQHKTYINEYMIQVEKYEKIQEQQLMNEKLKIYEKSVEADSK